MGKFVCSVCSYVYDEARGIPNAGIAPGTPWEALPEDWVCPVCGASKSEFNAERAEEPVKVEAAPTAQGESEDQKELSALEASILCSNLARGCEKQYKAEEAALFSELSAYFGAAAAPVEAPDADQILALIERDLNEGLPAANAAAEGAKDRGALRALVWSGKVTRILKSLLTRYGRGGEALPAGTGIYVCTICGFVSVGETPPALCPVCKVPGWKFEKVEGRARA